LPKLIINLKFIRLWLAVEVADVSIAKVA
jgi:hypothetical protein